VKPIIWGVDSRIHRNISVRSQRIQKIHDWILYCTQYADILRQPSSVEESIELIKRGSLGHRWYVRHSQSAKQLAHYVKDQYARLDKNHLQAMRACSSKRDQCVLIAGTTHCLPLFLSTKWTMELCGVNAQDMYTGYLVAYACTQSVLSE
jgi:hypothetical protein